MLRIVPLLLVALITVSCRSAFGPDATPAAPRDLPLGQTLSDTVQCGNDCSDVYRVLTSRPGQLAIELRALGRQGEVRLTLQNARARILHEEILAAGDETRVIELTEPDEYLIEVQALSPARIVYDLTTRLDPTPSVSEPPPGRPARERVAAPTPKPPTRRPPPPSPRVAVVNATVEDVDRRPGGQSVLLASDRASEIRVGQRGRLLENGRVVAEIRVVEIFPGGGFRAVIEGELDRPLAGNAVAEISVPRR